MTINNKKTNIEDFANKVVDALKAGLKDMAEKAAANNESLVIAHKDGSFDVIPAKELLKNPSK
jgi:hypothetical protein